MNKVSSYTAEEVRYISKSSLVFNLGYVGSAFGVLNIIQFILVLVSWSLVVNFQGYYSFPITIFFLIISCIVWSYVIFEFMAYFFDFYKKFRSAWAYIVLFFELSCAAAMITITGLLVYLARILSDQNLSPFFCKCLVVITSCQVLYWACVFGFLAGLAFIIDAFLHYSNYQSYYRVHSHYTS